MAAWAALLIATSITASACAAVVAGIPVKPGSGPTVDTTRLDVGNYPTKPRPPLGNAGTAAAGRIIDAQRMANYVVGPWEADPDLRSGYAMGALVLKDADALTSIGPAEFAAAAARHTFINGFVSARQDEGRKTLMNTVLRFADPPAAAKAAAELANVASTEDSTTAPQRVPIPGHSAAVATSYTVLDNVTNRQWTAVRSFTPHGPYVLTQLAQSADGMNAAVALITTSLNMQIPIIDRFEATDPALFADIAVDPTDLLARTLPIPPQEATVVQNARYGKRGALHFQRDPVESAALFDRTVMDLAAMAQTNVYRTADYDSALRIVEEFAAADVEASGGQSVDGVDYLPNSRCVKRRDGFYCVAAADRFAIEAQSTHLADARQQIAAQYSLLVAK